MGYKEKCLNLIMESFKIELNSEVGQRNYKTVQPWGFSAKGNVEGKLAFLAAYILRVNYLG
jgi:hypothetical protein